MSRRSLFFCLWPPSRGLLLGTSHAARAQRCLARLADGYSAFFASAAFSASSSSDTLVVGRQDLDEARQSTVEVKEDASRELGASVVVVIFDQATNEGDLGGILNARKLNHLQVDLGLEVLVHVEDVGNTTRHTSSEVAASGSKDENTTTSHVLTTVVTNTFNNSSGTRVSDSESLGSNTSEEACTTSAP